MFQVKSFKDYVELYLKGKEDDMGNSLKCVYENVNPRWEVAVAVSDKGFFQQVSFVNSIATTKVRYCFIIVILNFVM
jgi:DNA topoisomerase-2